MYKRHSIWDEDKWNIHSGSSGSGYAGHGSGKNSAGYSSSNNPMETYHKSQMYNSSKDGKANDLYRNNEAQEEERKKKENPGKTLADAVNQEEKEKYQKKEDTASAQEAIKSQHESLNLAGKENDSSQNSKRQNKKSIEDAISDAIKEEKEVIHLD